MMAIKPKIGEILFATDLSEYAEHAFTYAAAMSGSLLYRLNLRGIHGAFGLGLAYGILSGACTFGFIAPILTIVTVQQKIVAGSAMMVLFAVGHCLPIAVAGSSMAMVRKVTESCDLGHELALFLKEMGFENVRVLVNGWAVWQQAGLPTDRQG